MLKIITHYQAAGYAMTAGEIRRFLNRKLVGRTAPVVLRMPIKGRGASTFDYTQMLCGQFFHEKCQVSPIKAIAGESTRTRETRTKKTQHLIFDQVTGKGDIELMDPLTSGRLKNLLAFTRRSPRILNGDDAYILQTGNYTKRKKKLTWFGGWQYWPIGEILYVTGYEYFAGNWSHLEGRPALIMQPLPESIPRAEIQPGYKYAH